MKVLHFHTVEPAGGMAVRWGVHMLRVPEVRIAINWTESTHGFPYH